jgi:hypothetical protein
MAGAVAKTTAQVGGGISGKLPSGIGRLRTKLHAIMTETHQQLQIGNLDVKLGKLGPIR